MLIALRVADPHRPPLDPTVLRVEVIIDPCDVMKATLAFKPNSYSINISLVSKDRGTLRSGAQLDGAVPRSPRLSDLHTSGEIVHYVDSIGATIFALLSDGSLLRRPLSAPPAGTTQAVQCRRNPWRRGFCGPIHAANMKTWQTSLEDLTRVLQDRGNGAYPVRRPRNRYAIEARQRQRACTSCRANDRRSPLVRPQPRHPASSIRSQTWDEAFGAGQALGTAAGEVRGLPSCARETLHFGRF
jgi:hypothetical protein